MGHWLWRQIMAADRTGVIGGTANPKGEERQKVALISTGNTGEGGSYALTQKWVHNLAAFEELTIPEQEKVIGRTKVESAELEGDAMPPDSHVAVRIFRLMALRRRFIAAARPTDLPQIRAGILLPSRMIQIAFTHTSTACLVNQVTAFTTN